MKSLSPARALLAIAGVAGALGLEVVACSSTPTFDEGASSSGSSSASSSGGAACKTPDDCSGDETECSHRICSEGKCGFEDAPQGFLVGTQTSGDCQRTICDGKGASVTAPDDADLPDDGNACTQDLCQAGKPSHPATPKGTTCGATQMLTCDGAGACGGCALDAECGANGPCISYACDQATKQCKLTYVAAGQGDPGGQSAGDCKKLVCNGSGGPATESDDADVPLDGNDCTLDLCAMGAPSHQATKAGTPCGASSTCDGSGVCACPQANACTALFDDGFPGTTGLGASWKVWYGSFSTDGTYAVSGAAPSQGDWASLVPSVGTNDYAVAARMLVPPGSLNSGIVARSGIPGDFTSDLYAAQIASTGALNLYRRNDYNWSLLGTYAAGIQPNTPYTVKLLVTGGAPVHLEVSFDGAVRITYDDASASRLTTGIPGIEVYDGAVQYDSFSVLSN